MYRLNSLHQRVGFLHQVSFLAVFVVLTSCSSQVKRDENVSTGEPTASKRECFGFFGNRDTMLLSFERVGGDSIRGNLVYDFFEKDGSRGPITGTLRNDVLIARYEFQSEGTTSVRQVAFKKSGDAWVEGFGDVTEHNSEMIFKNANSLQYNDAFKLTPVDCK